MDLFDTIPCLEDDAIILRAMTEADADDLEKFCSSEAVYRYLPAFLYEKQEKDKRKVIRGMYGSCIENRESIHLGVYRKMSGEAELCGENEKNPEVKSRFCGIAEIYNYEPEIPKVSIGCRLAEAYWGQGIATRAIGLLTDYLMNQAGMLVITAHVMVENVASGKACLKNRYRKRILNVPEDWGFEEPVLVDKYVYKEEYFK